MRSEFRCLPLSLRFGDITLTHESDFRGLKRTQTLADFRYSRVINSVVYRVTKRNKDVDRVKSRNNLTLYKDSVVKNICVQLRLCEKKSIKNSHFKTRL